MANIPVPRSYSQILGDQIDAFLSRYGLKQLKVGSPVLSILEAASQSDLRSSQDIFDLLNSTSLDRATGIALDRIGEDENIGRILESPSVGSVDISDTSFQKISTNIYSGTAAPIAGSTQIHVIDASSFPASGSVFLGRGTTFYEGPIAYGSTTDNGTYWTINLSAPTTRFHNFGETAVLAQGGNRSITSGTIVQTPQGNINDAVQFSVLYNAAIPDGETVVQGVTVVAKKPGLNGNVTAKTVSQFQTAPFAGATVSNPLPFTSGAATESDEAFRERIKAVRQSRVKGTPLAVENSVIGITATDENKRVSSVNLVTLPGVNSTLYIDDGTGYEELPEGIALESLTDSALGGETYFQISESRPVTKAFITSLSVAPFQLANGDQLSVAVGGIVSTHTFATSEFVSIGNASAYEVVSSINGNENITFSARTAAGGTKVVLVARTDENEDLQVTADPGSNFGFTLTRVETMFLYKNDTLLSKDGRPATLLSNVFGTWNVSPGSKTLIIAIDGTPAITYTFTDADFVSGDTGFTSVGNNTIEAWVIVINNKIPGITATASGGNILLTSNLGPKAKSAIDITGGTLIGTNMFDVASNVGRERDYTLDRNTGQIRLEAALLEGDKLSASTINTRAYIESMDLAPITTTTPANLWLAVDGDASIIKTGVSSATSLAFATASKGAYGHRIKISGPVSTFVNVQKSDWLVLWDSALASTVVGQYRISEASSTTVHIERRGMLLARSRFSACSLYAVPVVDDALINKVMFAGGLVTDTADRGVTDTCEIFDPNTGTSAHTGRMNYPRYGHKITMSPISGPGNVAAIGGKDVDGNNVGSIEIWNSTSGTWLVGAFHTFGGPLAVSDSGVVMLTTGVHAGKALVIGGSTSAAVSNQAKTLDLTTGLLSAPITMVAARVHPNCVVLPSGKVLVVGGYSDVAQTALLTSCEIIDATVLIPTSAATGSLVGGGRAACGIAATDDGLNVIIAGNHKESQADLRTSEIYDIGLGTWSAGSSIGSATATFFNKPLTTLPNGRIVAPFIKDPASTTELSYHRNQGSGLWIANVSFVDQDLEGGYYKDDCVAVKLRRNVPVYNAILVAGGTIQNTSATPSSDISAYISSTNRLGPYDIVESTGLLLPTSGLSVARTSAVLQNLVIPASAYTVDTLSAEFDSQLVGATALTYHTNRLRIRTNTYDITGDIGLVAQDVASAAFGLELNNTAVTGLTGHVGSLNTANSSFGTPSFTNQVFLGEHSFTAPGVGVSTLLRTSSDLIDNYWLGNMVIGAQAFHAYTVISPSAADDFWYSRYGNNKNQITTIHSASTIIGNDKTVNLASLRSTKPVVPYDRTWLAAPYAIGPNDDLGVVVDGDTQTKQYVTKMWRKLKPSSVTYAQTNAFKDADNSNQSLTQLFGLDYKFEDFVAYMKARALSNASDGTRSALWRYTRFGADGERSRVRYDVPTAPSQPVKVDVRVFAPFEEFVSDIKIRIGSGPLKTGFSIANGSRVGFASAPAATNTTPAYYFANLSVTTAVTIAGTTTYTTALPAGVSDHGFVAGNVLWFQSTNGLFPTQAITVSSATATTVSAVTGSIGAGPTAIPGSTMSFGPSENKWSGAPILLSDFVRLNGATGLSVEYTTSTGRIRSFTPGYLSINHAKFTSTLSEFEPTSPPLSSIISWKTISDSTGIQIFDNLQQTTTQVVAAVNALAAVANSTCPITGKVIGAGTGIIDRATPELTPSVLWYQLLDGVNWVSRTINPLSMAGDYSLVFKRPISSALALSSDWINEEVRVAPITNDNIVSWLSNLAVTGLSSTCAIEEVDRGSRVQLATLASGDKASVEVQGGLANASIADVIGSGIDTISLFSVYKNFSSVTITNSESTGFTANQWVSVDNANLLPKPVIDATTALTSITAAGVITLSAGPQFFTLGATETDSRVVFEKQGNFVAIHDGGNQLGEWNTVVSDVNTLEGAYIYVKPGPVPFDPDASLLNVGNEGTFRIIRKDTNGLRPGLGGTIWIENPAAVEQLTSISIRVIVNPVLPGDVLSIATEVWGVNNVGRWKVTEIGGGFVNPYQLTVDTVDLDNATHTIAPQTAVGALGAEAANIKIIEGTPARLIKQIYGISPNTFNGQYVDLRFNTAAGIEAHVTESSGTTVKALDKLAFPGGVYNGIDGYSHSIGLIGEANRILYGDPQNPSVYPGVAAAGATIDISGPLVKAINVTLAIRTKSGISLIEIADNVRSAAASVINASGVGESVAISDIVAAASQVVGVVAVSVISPTYNSSSDLIKVQPYEKPMVLNLEQNVIINFVGD